MLDHTRDREHRDMRRHTEWETILTDGRGGGENGLEKYFFQVREEKKNAFKLLFYIPFYLERWDFFVVCIHPCFNPGRIWLPGICATISWLFSLAKKTVYSAAIFKSPFLAYFNVKKLIKVKNLKYLYRNYVTYTTFVISKVFYYFSI